jgi:GAF domain-containing protein
MPDAVNRRLLDVLTSLAEELVTRLDADGCAISRVIGDVLIMVAEKVPPNRSLLHGQGYLISEYPQTAEVLSTGEPRALTLEDRDLDESEASVLREQGFASLVMTPLFLGSETWGLVEVYRIEPRPFDDAAKRIAVELSRI